MKFKTEVGPDHVLMGWMVRHCAVVVNNFQGRELGERLIVLSGARTTMECLGETILRMEPC